MYVSVDGARLWFDIEGAVLPERPTVVLLHGGPGSFDHSYFKPHFSRLAETAEVVYLDLPGHGRSDWGDPNAWSFEACADAVRGFCEALGLRQPVLYGHSLGGMVAMLYGARHPGHARMLLLVSTAGRFDVQRLVEGFRRAGGDGVAEIASRAYFGEPVTDEEWARCCDLFGPNVPDTETRARLVVNEELNELWSGRLGEFDVLDRLGAIQSPTLVWVGELDPVTPVAAAEELAAAVPRARLEVLSGAGHWPWLDTPERHWELLVDVLAEAS
ncbi:MAG TPA: alpha/beta hydrolase [Gaiellaceae bacterium]|nr:alpha/beta hydrolase [Gaiellaceae bacterium]